MPVSVKNSDIQTNSYPPFIPPKVELDGFITGISRQGIRCFEDIKGGQGRTILKIGFSFRIVRGMLEKDNLSGMHIHDAIFLNVDEQGTHGPSWKLAKWKQLALAVGQYPDDEEESIEFPCTETECEGALLGTGHWEGKGMVGLPVTIRTGKPYTYQAKDKDTGETVERGPYTTIGSFLTTAMTDDLAAAMTDAIMRWKDEVAQEAGGSGAVPETPF